MTTHSLTLREDQKQELAALLHRGDGHEHAAYLVCRRVRARRDPWDREAHTKFLVTRIVPVPDDDVVESGPSIITWRTVSFVRLLRETAGTGEVVAIIHSHGAGIDFFSAQDDANEPDLVQLALNRNGEGTEILSLILTADGIMRGRLWFAPRADGHVPLRMIRVIGKRIVLHCTGRNAHLSLPSLARQALAFGDAFNADLRTLRIGIVGCGGTGSAVVQLLARLGVGQLVVIDNDIVDRTNLDRLHGARQSDADAMRPKVDVVAEAVTSMGLGVRVVPIEGWVGDPGCRDALRSCDIIFGCTDDHDGRLLLNRFAYYYLTPVIDVGLAIEVGPEEAPTILAMDARVTVLSPGETCLSCRGVITPETARGESLRRRNPEDYEQRKREAYVAGEGNPAPSVVTFTTEAACMAVNELIQRLQGFRGPEGSASNRVRKLHLSEDRFPGHKSIETCPVCGSRDCWGRGDVEPFLDRVG